MYDLHLNTLAHTDYLKAVTSTVSNVVNKVATVLPAVVVQAAKTVVHAVTTVLNTAFSPSVHITLPVNVGPPASSIQGSPFGPVFQIYKYEVPDSDPKKDKFAEKLDSILDQLLPEAPGAGPEPGVVFYCVNCGIHGTVQVAGSVSFSLLNGFTAGNVGLSGNLRAGLEIGVDAFAEYQNTITVARLVHQGIPGFSIPDVITIGPEITLDMTADFDISAEG